MSPVWLVPLFALAADPARTDADGYPLPPGTTARLGSIHLRADHVRHLRFSPDGRTFRAFVAGPAWAEWDTVTGRLLRRVPLPGSDHTRFWVSADGSRAVWTDVAGRRRVVDMPAGTRRFELPAWAELDHLAHPFSPDGRRLAAFDKRFGGTDPQAVHVWDTTTGAVRRLGGQGDVMCQVRFSPDGRRLVAHSGAAATCWDVDTGAVLWKADKVPLTGNPVLWQPDGSRVAVSYRPDAGRPKLDLWDAATGRPVPGTKLPADGFTPLHFTDDPDELLVDRNPAVGVWSLSRGEYRHTMLTGGAGVQLAVHGRIAVTASGFFYKHLLDPGPIPSPFKSNTATGFPDWQTRLAVAPSGRHVVTTGGLPQRITVWDIRTGQEMHRHLVKWSGRGIEPAPAFSLDGRTMAVAYYGGPPETWYAATFDTAIWQPDRVREDRFVMDRWPHRHVITGPPRLSPGGRQLRAVAVSEDVQLVGIDVTTGKTLAPVRLNATASLDRFPGVVSPDGRTACDGLAIYAAHNGQRQATLEGAAGATYGEPFFSRDGRFVAVRVARVLPTPMHDRRRWGFDPYLANNWLLLTASPEDDLGVRVWDTLTGRVVSELPVAGRGTIALAADGRQLAVADHDALTVWSVADRRSLLTHPAHRREVNQAFAVLLALGPDGRTAVTTHRDFTGLVWDLSAARVPPAGPPPTAAELAAAWAAFAGLDPAAAFAAMWRLVDHPRQAVPFLAARLVPAEPTAAVDVPAAIRELDAADYRAREAAGRQLLEAGEPARGAMRAALAGTPSAEQRTRLEQLLARLDAAPLPPLTDAERPAAWGLAVLERIHTPDARAVMRRLAGGAGGRRITREAAAALARLEAGGTGR